MTKDDHVPAVDSTEMGTNPVGPYTVYAAGGLFTQHELAVNVLIKEAVWRLSAGKFQSVLPQSKELREPELEAAYLRNVDLLEMVKADIVMARFDGLELDAGTVVEFTMAKGLGKPTVILRCDSRHLSAEGLDEPYNLMVKSWPRTVQVHIDSVINYLGLFVEAGQTVGDRVTFEGALKAELKAVQKGIDEIARQIIAGLEAVIKLKSPYPPEYREVVYQAARYSPGSGFEQMLTEAELGKIVRRLRSNGML